MLTRQKILLFMLKEAGRPVQRIELMKWCFLLRYESSSRGGSSFYDFVPYKLGPFSFSMYQELEKLQGMSYVLSVGDKGWRLNPDFMLTTNGINQTLQREVRDVLERFADLSSGDLLNYVYQRYPAFTVNSERLKLALRPKARLAVYTAGYEGSSIDGFLHILVESGIELVIDVRSNPIARRYGFHKSTLKRLVGRLDIEYCHFAELGIQSKIRRLYPPDCDRKTMLDEYEETTLCNEATSLQALSMMLCSRPSVLVCMEADPSSCHRSRLAMAVSKSTRLPIVHLRADL